MPAGSGGAAEAISWDETSLGFPAAIGLPSLNPHDAQNLFVVGFGWLHCGHMTGGASPPIMGSPAPRLVASSMNRCGPGAAAAGGADAATAAGLAAGMSEVAGANFFGAPSRGSSAPQPRQNL
jgi:hypothetical protein